VPPDTCPNCGADVPKGAKACPECGADEKTGWSKQARYGGLNLPDEDFDYNDFAKREFGGPERIPRGVHWLWWLIGVLVSVGFISLLIRAH
jgi:ssDNA-binding Zn-finger/Zn-ribbon topoisomerase 1